MRKTFSFHKNILLILLAPIFVAAQVNINYFNNACPEEDVLSACLGEIYPFEGSYSYLTVYSFCNPGGEALELVGETSLSVNDRGHYYAPDFSFGAWEACFGLENGPLGTVEMRANCNTIEGVFGTDRYGDIWSSDQLSFENNSFTFNWFNTYGEFGTTTLTPNDGRILDDPTQVLESAYQFLWSNGSQTQTITTNDVGEFSVTVTDLNGESSSSAIQVVSDYSSLNLLCANDYVEVEYFWDKNENGVQESDEINLQVGDKYLELNPSEKLYGIFGDYKERFVLSAGTYSLNFINTKFRATNLVSEFEIAENSGAINYKFGLKEIVNVESADISITPASAERCNLVVPFNILIRNTGTLPYKSKLTLTIDPLIKYISSDNTPVEVENNYVSWNIEVPEPTKTKKIIVYLQMPSFEFVGDILCLDLNTDLNTRSYNSNCFELRCSHDPNDKHGTPFRGAENQTRFDEEFEYKIRFENLGNDTAFNVQVEDVLSKFLDVKSFRFIQASHEVSRYWIDPFSVLHFEFDNINLPSLIQDSVGNKGFIQFAIKPNSGLAENTIIENTADIFFDSNPAVVTNTTSHVMVSELETTAVLEQLKYSFTISPNPSFDYIKLSNLKSLKEIKSVNIFDVSGKNVGSYLYYESLILINHLNIGLYFVEVVLENGERGVQRFVKM